MTRHFLNWRRTIAAIGVLIATCGVRSVHGQTTYTFVTQSEPTQSVNWHDSSVWSPTGIPNAVGDTALFVRPTVVPSVPFSVIVDQDTTVGAITVDNAGFNTNNNLIIDMGGTLTFESTTGTATLTETAGGASAGRLDLLTDITLNSDLLLSQSNRSDLNSSSFLRGLVTGGTNRTITKQGPATAQFEHHGASGFQGQYVINEGGIRFTGSTNISQSSGVTVSSGGQLQFNAAAGGPEFHDWTLADGAVLTLNGPGRTDLAGALRFQGAAGSDSRTSKFHSPVVLDSNARIGTGPAAVTGELTNTVSGDGGLTKNGPGILILSNPGNSFAGNTTIEGNAGTLSLLHPTLSDNADVSFLADNSFLNLNYTGTDSIRSFFIAGVQQQAGTWGATGNLAADFQSPRITGTGLLDVLVGPSTGLDGDYNEDGVVDAADYVLWRSDPEAFGGDPGYATWVANFGNTESGGGSRAGLASVPEPSTSVLALLAAFGLLTMAIRR